ncbi:MAG TPA: quinol:electron acceptor oxidoreductase subunit ActD [Polyangiaceae bacterium]|nr:quinol:electron acceptor oxidoreductase subunit ActD [Polyangiaceae bacterium]
MSDAHQPEETPAGPAPLHALLAEYDTPAQIVAASRKVRDAGFTRWDTYTPFPVHGIDKAMGIKMTILPWIVLGAGLTGLATAITLQWWTNAYDYPWLISGKPFWSIPANVPIMFELTVLFSAITTLVGMLMLNNLPLPSHPLDRIKRFARSTDDKFFLVIEAADPKFDEEETRALIESTGPHAIEEVPEDHTSSDALPNGLVYGLIIVSVLAAVPFAIAAKARYSRGPNPRIHAIGDMDWQPKYKAQRMNPVFDDHRSTREDVPGTVAVGELREDDHLYRGKVGEAWATTFPEQIPLTDATMKRGAERFGIYCTPCHGIGGEGDGMVAKRAEMLAEGTWVQPSNLTQEYLRLMPVGALFNTVTNGIRNMPAYGSQILTEDRWAIIMYLRALQRSHVAKLDDVPPDLRAGLK